VPEGLKDIRLAQLLHEQRPVANRLDSVVRAFACQSYTRAWATTAVNTFTASDGEQAVFGNESNYGGSFTC
jgi:hypothetical protein